MIGDGASASVKLGYFRGQRVAVKAIIGSEGLGRNFGRQGSLKEPGAVDIALAQQQLEREDHGHHRGQNCGSGGGHIRASGVSAGVN